MNEEQYYPGKLECLEVIDIDIVLNQIHTRTNEDCKIGHDFADDFIPGFIMDDMRKAVAINVPVKKFLTNTNIIAASGGKGTSGNPYIEIFALAYEHIRRNQ